MPLNVLVLVKAVLEEGYAEVFLLDSELEIDLVHVEDVLDSVFHLVVLRVLVIFLDYCLLTQLQLPLEHLVCLLQAQVARPDQVLVLRVLAELPLAQVHSRLTDLGVEFHVQALLLEHQEALHERFLHDAEVVQDKTEDAIHAPARALFLDELPRVRPIQLDIVLLQRLAPKVDQVAQAGPERLAAVFLHNFQDALRVLEIEQAVWLTRLNRAEQLEVLPQRLFEALKVAGEVNLTVQ